MFLGESSKVCPSPLVTEMQEEQRLRRSTKKQAMESYSGAFPILIKGDQVQYVPWGSLDLEGLIHKLPNINDGAAKWIRTFE